ncbi:MAG TPA: glycosyltransferase family 4 protein [Candidatus Saccharimonadales bacterium]|nr:glycosyltransferase family 4 protein [Candidatus Saccharimonadales bacterium]
MSDKKTKRLLIVGQHYWPETFRITDIAEGLVERGYKVDVLCGTPNYPSGKFFTGYGFFKNKREVRKGVTIYRVPEIPRGSNTNVRISLNYVSFAFFALFYVPFFIFRKYDRVMAYQLSPVFMSLPAILIAKIKRIPLYFYVCDFWPHSLFSMINIQNPTLRSLITRMSYWHYRRGDGVMGVFKGMQERFISDVGIPEEKTLYIAQAPEKIYEQVIEDKSLNKRFGKTFNVVFAGNINPAQCFDVVTKAAKIVKDKGYKNIRYIIIGEGMSKDWLIKEVKKLRIDDQFVFEGFKPVEEVPKYQSIANVMLVALSKSPLFEYGIPAKVYSYMPSGKPIVASMDGEGKKLVNELSRCGICVDSGDIEGLAGALIKLHDMEKSKRDKLGKNGRDYYFKHFEREPNLTRLEEFVFKDNRIADTEY